MLQTDAARLEEVLIVLTGVRAALVRVMQQPDRRPPALQRHLERLDRQMSVVDRADGPPHDEPREQIEDGGEIELAAAPDDELGRVADPPLIRRRCGKLPIEQIGGDRLVVVAHRGHLVAFARPRLQAVFLHQTDHALAAHVLVLLDEIFVNARAAVPLPALVEGRLDQYLQATIVARMRRFRTALPGVEAAARHAQTATEDGDRMLGLLSPR